MMLMIEWNGAEGVSLIIPKGLELWLSKEGRNIAFHAGNLTKEAVKQNQSIELQSRGYSIEQLCFLNQVHGDNILKASSGGLLGDGDGIVLDKIGLVGLIMVADCNPIVVFDRAKRVLVLLHVGRLGVEKGIVFKAFSLLQREYQSCLSDLFVYIGPSIRGCCYEVGIEVLSQTLESGKITKERKIYLDLIEVLKEQFKEIGICDYEIDPLCTCCSGRYFSYRRDRNCGRFGIFASLTEK